MNELEHQLDYPLGDTLPPLGTTIELAPGVRWLRMVLPFALDHINLWLLRDRIDGREGWSIVDCGISSDTTRAAWEQVFANDLQGLPVLRVIVTHMHPDHVGLAHWLTGRWSTPDHECRLWMSATDYNAARTACMPSAKAAVLTPQFAQAHGITDPDAIEKLKGRGSHFASLVPAMPERFARLLDGDVLRIGEHDWTCHVGYGHAPEHMSLHCPALGVLISGDMVLPRISTNVSVFDIEPLSNPVQWFLDSLKKFEGCDEDTLVLPSHGRPFRKLHVRLRQLDDHHHERLSMLLSACSERSLTAAQAVSLMFNRTFDTHQMTFALGESLAHLHALWYAGKAGRTIDKDEVVRFAGLQAA